MPDIIAVANAAQLLQKGTTSSSEQRKTVEVLKNLPEGVELKATVVEDLGAGRYRLNVPQQNGTSAEVVLDIPRQLEVGQEVGIQVDSGKNISVILDSEAASLGGTDSAPASEIKSADAVFRQSHDIVVKVDAPVADVLKAISDYPVKENLVLSVDSSGNIYSTLPASDGGEGLTLPLAKDAFLQQIISSLPEGSTLSLNVAEVNLSQAIKIETQSEQTFTGTVFTAENLTGENTSTSKSVPQIPLAGRQQSITASSVLPQNTDLQMTVEDIAGQKVVLASMFGKSEVSLSKMDAGAFTSNIDVGQAVAVEAHEPDLRFTGKVEIHHGRNVAVIEDASEFSLIKNFTDKVPSERQITALIKNAGLVPDAKTRTAVSALLMENSTVSRESIQNLLGLESQINQRAEPLEVQAELSLMRAIVRQVKNDMPVTPQLARGLASIITTATNATSLLEGALSTLENIAFSKGMEIPPEQAVKINESLQVTLQTLKDIPVNIAQESLAQGLFESSGKMAMENIGAVINNIENTIGMLLESDSLLSSIDNIISGLSGVIGKLSSGESEISQKNIYSNLLKADIDRLVNVSGDKVELQNAISNIMKDKGVEYLKSLMAGVESFEVDTIKQHQAISNLTKAHSALTELFERNAAYKAQNINSADKMPSVYYAEIPVKLDEKSGDAMLKFFGRKTSGKGTSGKSRVVLDLNMSSLGPVVSDMNFYSGRLQMVIGTADEVSSDALSSEVDSLEKALKEKGFNPSITFRIISPSSNDDPAKRSPLTLKAEETGSILSSSKIDLEA